MPTHCKGAIHYFENLYIIPGISYIIHTFSALKFQRKPKRLSKDEVYYDVFLTMNQSI